MDEDKSQEIILHETLSEIQSMDVSESECNIVHENYRRTIRQTYQIMLLRNWKTMSIKNIQWLKKEQVILTYSIAVEIYWIFWHSS